jgi:hypothetical protein
MLFVEIFFSFPGIISYILKIFGYNGKKIIISRKKCYRSFSSDVTAAILVYQNNEMAAILVYGTGISSFLFKYFVLFHHPTGATDHVSENDLYIRKIFLVCPGNVFEITLPVANISGKKFLDALFIGKMPLKAWPPYF